MFILECEAEACWLFLGLYLSSNKRAPDRIIKEAMSNLFAIPLSTSETVKTKCIDHSSTTTVMREADRSSNPQTNSDTKLFIFQK